MKYSATALLLRASLRLAEPAHPLPEPSGSGWKQQRKPLRPAGSTFLLAVIATASMSYLIAGDAVANPPTKGESPAQSAPARMPIYITPYYNSDPLQVNVGPHSEELASATTKTAGELATKLKQEWATLPVETMYVLAIRLYDLGLKDQAVYWFYTAQLRARLLSALLPAGMPARIGNEGFERIQAHRSFHQLAGTYINGYAFGQLEQLEKTLRQVKSESEQLPPFNTIYPQLELIEEHLWAEKNQEVATGIDKLLEYIADNAEEIKTIRKQRGMEGKY